jgi:hypothetical protein
MFILFTFLLKQKIWFKSSGVKVDPSCIEAYNEFKLGNKKEEKKQPIAFLIFGFNDKATHIVVKNEERVNFDDKAHIKEKSKFNLSWIN